MAEEEQQEQQYEDKKKCIRPRERACRLSRSKTFITHLLLIPDFKKPFITTILYFIYLSNSNQTSGHASFMFVFFLFEKEF